MVWHAQSAAWRLLGHPISIDPSHVVQFLSALSPRCLGGIPNLRACAMRILLVTPSVPRGGMGNRVTALRWVRMLRGLGHRVMVVSEYGSEPCDVLVALHARK